MRGTPFVYGGDEGRDGAPRCKFVVTPDLDLFRAQLAEWRDNGWRILTTCGYPATGMLWFDFPGAPFPIFSYYAFLDHRSENDPGDDHA